MFPYLGKSPIAQLRAPDVLSALKRIEARGKMETAHRVRSDCGNVFRYAVVTGRAERDPTVDLRGAIAAVCSRNRPAITDPHRIGELLRAIDGYRGDLSTEFALRILPLTFVRPGELRLAEWIEYDLGGAEWRIPPSRMKMGELHVVPLSTQAVALLRDLAQVTGGGRLLFPSIRPERDGWHPDLIELQLAHAERDEVRGAYNRAQRLAERRAVMQAWADYLDQPRTRAQKTSTPNLNCGPSIPEHVRLATGT